MTLPGSDLLVGAFAMGLLGSAHCLGMCGGFAVLAGRRRGAAHYALGKTLTYGVLGLLAGGLGHLVMRVTTVQSVLAVLTGAFLVVMGAATAGLVPERLTGSPWITRRVAPLLGEAMRKVRGLGPLALGTLNGLLPCGLVYAALALAMASGSPGRGGLLMVIFGLGTLPALLLLSVAADRLNPVWRAGFVRVGGVLIMVLGAITVWRAFTAPGMAH